MEILAIFHGEGKFDKFDINETSQNIRQIVSKNELLDRLFITIYVVSIFHL